MRVKSVLLGVAACWAVLLNCQRADAAAEKKVVCYYGSWSVYRRGAGKFDVEDIDPSVCTHAIYTFVGLTQDADFRVMDEWNDLETDSGRGGFKRFTNIKKLAPELKTLVAIGGWNEGSLRYSQVFGEPDLRTVFTANAVRFLKKHDFDGLDLDWEYPGQRGGSSEDRHSFSELIRELRAAFDEHGLLLTAAVAAAEFSMTQSYDPAALGKYLDFINVMTYDFHGAWEKTTGHNAPLSVSATEVGTANAELNVNASIQAWIRLGAPAEKLVLGVGLYGRTFSLSSSDCTAPRCPVNGPGSAGVHTGENGFLGYNEICQIEAEADAKKYWDEEAQVPYMVKGNQWIGYDDERSVQLKVDYILNNNLGGAMVWSVDTDDFTNGCGRGEFPLLTILKNGMAGAASSSSSSSSSSSISPPPSSSGSSTSTSSSTPTSTSSSTSTSPPSSTASFLPGPCSREGFVRDAVDCAVFYYCRFFGDSFIPHKFTCPAGLNFDLNLRVCNYAASVNCKNYNLFLNLHSQNLK